MHEAGWRTACNVPRSMRRSYANLEGSLLTEPRSLPEPRLPERRPLARHGRATEDPPSSAKGARVEERLEREPERAWGAPERDLAPPSERASRTSDVVEARRMLRQTGGRLTRRSLEAMTGRVVAERYRVLGEIGSGGMGAIYEAIDLQTGMTVALKALQSGVHDADRLKRLRREAEIAATVRSRNICKVHYLGVDQGTPFIVMERLHGETLRERLRRVGPLPVGEAVAITCQLLDALAAIHEAGVIHRDVKPSNIYLTSNDDEPPQLKLIDFGVGMFAPTPRAGEGNSSGSETIAGTLHYLAPEQLLAVGSIDARVDVYTAGAVLFEMLTGRRAWEGGYPEIVHDILLAELPSVKKLRPELPAAFDGLLAMAMAKSRDRRFASAQAFKRALSAALDEVPRSGVVTTSGIAPARGDEDIDIRIDLELDDDDSDEEGLKPTLRPPPAV